MKIKIYNKIKLKLCKLVRNNEVLKVFSKEYREETKYQIFIENNAYRFRLEGALNDEDEMVKEIMKVLKK